jgi:thymidylate synthase
MNLLNKLRNVPVKRLYIRQLSLTQTKEERKEKQNWITTKQPPLALMGKNVKNIKQEKHQENQYLQLISKIIREGEEEETRNGVTKSIIGASMRYSLSNGQIPLLTTKKLAWKSCLKELLWFISGDTNNETLVKQNVKIWNDNASREFLDSRNLRHLKEGDLGPIYGYQWRFYNLLYIPLHIVPSANINKIRKNIYGGVDQLTNIIKCLQDPEERYSRRLIMTAWNPEQIDQMALPPCHVMSQFSVLGNKLHCTMYQRSGDVGLGIPFNIASYSFLTILLAKHCGLEPGEFIHFIGNAHIYKEHEKMLMKQIKRKPKQFPTCEIKNIRQDIDDYVFADFDIHNYNYHPPIKMDMIP